VPHAGIGAEILACQGSDGAWHRADEPDWLPTLFMMQLLRATGVDRHDPAVASAVARLRPGFRWDESFGAKPFFEGEVEPCINGGALALGAYFGRPSESLAQRLLGEQLDDGGWNCDAPKSLRSSYHTTICVLEGLLEYERAVGSVRRSRGPDGEARSTCSSARSSGGARPARSRVRRSCCSRSRPGTTTTSSVRSTTSGPPMSSPTPAWTKPCASSKQAAGRWSLAARCVARRSARLPVQRVGGGAEPVEHAPGAAGASLGRTMTRGTGARDRDARAWSRRQPCCIV
jgi:hypothetical protein